MLFYISNKVEYLKKEQGYKTFQKQYHYKILHSPLQVCLSFPVIPSNALSKFEQFSASFPFLFPTLGSRKHHLDRRSKMVLQLGHKYNYAVQVALFILDIIIYD